jgi:oryzin
MSTSNYGPVGKLSAHSINQSMMPNVCNATDKITVDIFAPGQQIPSLGIAGNTAIATFSGTSMAAAHIAGLGAYFLALEGPRTAAALCARLREVATPNVLTGVPAGTANLLAYNLSGL